MGTWPRYFKKSGFSAKNFVAATISNSHTTSELNYYESQKLMKLIGGVHSITNMFYISRQI